MIRLSPEFLRAHGDVRQRILEQRLDIRTGFDERHQPGGRLDDQRPVPLEPGVRPLVGRLRLVLGGVAPPEHGPLEFAGAHPGERGGNGGNYVRNKLGDTTQGGRITVNTPRNPAQRRLWPAREEQGELGREIGEGEEQEGRAQHAQQEGEGR